jgi:hypothetical protein
MKVKEVKKCPLSTEFKVACEIYRGNERKEPVWLQKLVKNLYHKIDKKDIERVINTLFDWGVIRAEYGYIEKGKKGRLYFIANEAKDVVKSLYEHYWETTADKKKQKRMIAKSTETAPNLREADSCNICEHYIPDKHDPWGVCKIHTTTYHIYNPPMVEKTHVFIHQICDDFKRRGNRND